MKTYDVEATPAKLGAVTDGVNRRGRKGIILWLELKGGSAIKPFALSESDARRVVAGFQELLSGGGGCLSDFIARRPVIRKRNPS